MRGLFHSTVVLALSLGIAPAYAGGLRGQEPRPQLLEQQLAGKWTCAGECVEPNVCLEFTPDHRLIEWINGKAFPGTYRVVGPDQYLTYDRETGTDVRITVTFPTPDRMVQTSDRGMRLEWMRVE